jgi:hypothetical protein
MRDGSNDVKDGFAVTSPTQVVVNGSRTCQASAVQEFVD